MLAANRALAFGFLLLGAVILVRTISLGGGQVGFLAAAVFLALGALRLRASR
jgi:hypothetical protein